jgi:hypothetical protein
VQAAANITLTGARATRDVRDASEIPGSRAAVLEVRIHLPPAASHTNSIIVTGLCESLENRRTIDEIDSTLTAKGPVGAPVKAPAV